MTTYYQVFVRSKQGDRESTLAEDVGQILGTPFHQNPSTEGLLAEAPTAFVDIYFEHELEDEPDLPFEEFPTSITVRDRDRNGERAKQVARSIYDGLVESGRYYCFLTYGVDHRIAGNLPPG